MPEGIRHGAQVRVEVPASSANLGPGFDSLGLGIELRDVVVVDAVGDRLSIVVSGAGAGEVPTDERHLVYRSMLTAWGRLGVQAPDGLRMKCTNVIPHSRGLGSSASAIVAGVTAAVVLTGRDLDEATSALISDISSALEGHPDNASASIYGGFTASWWSGEAWLTRCPPVHPDIDVLALVPDITLSTDKARSALPQQVPLADAASNAGRAALLVHAMTADPDVLHAATADWLHQENRRPAYPQSMAVVDALRAEGHAAFISGAGPTVLVLGRSGSLDQVDSPGEGWAALRPGIARDGVRVVSHIH
ncbi:homoserine kinase [Yimella sp. cx-573]|nr:homoserine kinase [Yimella sp. cx-573]